MPTDEEAALRDRLAKLTAEFRHAGREAVARQTGGLTKDRSAADKGRQPSGPVNRIESRANVSE